MYSMVSNISGGGNKRGGYYRGVFGYNIKNASYLIIYFFEKKNPK